MAVLTVILTILKILGTVLAVILALILLLLLIILFTPIRYRLYGKKEGELIKAHLRVTCILSAIRAYVDFTRSAEGENSIDICVKALFIKLFPRDEKGEINTGGSFRRRKKEKEPEAEQAMGSSASDFPSFDDDGFAGGEREEIPKAEEASKKESFFSRLKEKADALASLPHRAAEKYRSFRDEVSDKKQWLSDKLELLSEESSKRALAACIRTVRGLLLHIMPKKGSAFADLGFEDPSVTGSAVAVYSVLYPAVGRFFRLNAYFDKEIMDLRGDISGRIRLFTVIILALRLWFNKDFTYLRKKL